MSFESQGGGGDGTYDHQEIERAWADLGTGGRLLMAGAKALMRGFGLDPVRHNYKDLLYTALAKTLAGDRSWQEGVDFDHHLRQTMRSIGSGWKKRAVKEARAGVREVRFSELWPPGAKVDAKDLPESLQAALASPTPDPEAVLITRERIAAVLRACADDRPARQVIGCWARGLDGPEIQQRLRMSGRRYVTTVQRIRRIARRTEGTR